MMLPGVELARRRRFHNRSDVYVPSPLESSSSRSHPTAPPLPIDEPAAAAARRRLEEKLRGPLSGPRSSSSSLSSPSSPSSPSSFHRWMMRTSADNTRLIHSGQDSSTALSPRSTVLSPRGSALSPRSTVLSPRGSALSPHSTVLSPRNINKERRDGELAKRGSRADICAVCLDDFEAFQHTVWLPCAHRYHSSCVLPWLADHSQCPYCRAEVPSLDLLSERKP